MRRFKIAEKCEMCGEFTFFLYAIYSCWDGKMRVCSSCYGDIHALNDPEVSLGGCLKEFECKEELK